MKYVLQITYMHKHTQTKILLKHNRGSDCITRNKKYKTRTNLFLWNQNATWAPEGGRGRCHSAGPRRRHLNDAWPQGGDNTRSL